MSSALLEIQNVTVDIRLRRDRRRSGSSVLRAVDDATLTLEAGRTLGIVGESGSGKSTLAGTVVGTRRPTSGRVLFCGDDVTEFDGRSLKRFRRQVQVVFQDPSMALDPRMTLEQIVSEPMVVHDLGGTRTQQRQHAVELLRMCGLTASMAALNPHALSGGQKQRAALARALAAEPKLIIADEPTSALDVSVQSQMLALLQQLQRETGVAFLFISHDLGVIRQVAHDVAVMSHGRIVEHGPTSEVFGAPRHTYTQLLMASYDLRPRGNRTGLRAAT